VLVILTVVWPNDSLTLIILGGTIDIQCLTVVASMERVVTITARDQLPLLVLVTVLLVNKDTRALTTSTLYIEQLAVLAGSDEVVVRLVVNRDEVPSLIGVTMTSPLNCDIRGIIEVLTGMLHLQLNVQHRGGDSSSVAASSLRVGFELPKLVILTVVWPNDSLTLIILGGTIDIQCLTVVTSMDRIVTIATRNELPLLVLVTVLLINKDASTLTTSTLYIKQLAILARDDEVVVWLVRNLLKIPTLVGVTMSGPLNSNIRCIVERLVGMLYTEHDVGVVTPESEVAVVTDALIRHDESIK